MPTPNQICVIYQIWGEDLNRISKVQFDLTKTQISTQLIELHFCRTSNILVRADCQPSRLSSALEFSQRERGRAKNQWKWVLSLRENSLLCFYALILDFRSSFRGWNIWGQLF